MRFGKMDTSWFDPSLIWLPGIVPGILIGLWGGACGIFIPLYRNKRRGVGLKALRAGYPGVIVYSVVCLGIGIIVFINKQPYGIWYGLFLPGINGILCLGFNIRYWPWWLLILKNKGQQIALIPEAALWVLLWHNNCGWWILFFEL